MLWLLLPGYGVFPSEKSSHKTMPKDQTSDWVENTRSMMDSMAIHLTGSGPYFEAAEKKRTKDNRRPVNNNKIKWTTRRTSSVHTHKRRNGQLNRNKKKRKWEKKKYLAFLLVVSRTIDFTGQSKVGDFDNIIVGQKDVARCQVAVQNLEFNSKIK